MKNHYTLQIAGDSMVILQTENTESFLHSLSDELTTCAGSHVVNTQVNQNRITIQYDSVCCSYHRLCFLLFCCFSFPGKMSQWVKIKNQIRNRFKRSAEKTEKEKNTGEKPDSPVCRLSVEKVDGRLWLRGKTAPDLHSLRYANLLVGNSAYQTCLEFYGQSTTLVFDSDCLFCLTGADREALLDGKKLPLYAARFARAGEKLVLGKAVDGFRSYLSIRGGLFSLEIADESKDLQEGDTIGYSSLALPDDDIRFRRVFPDDWTDEPEIRAIPGPDMQLLSEEKMRNFFTTGYTVRILEENAPISLEGNWSFSTQKDEKGEEKESCCFTLPCGAICLEENRLLLFPAGERSQDQKEKKHPICLATVITADLPLLGQLSPGKRVHFRPVTVEAAQDLLKRRKKEYDRLSHKWNVSDLDSSEHQKGRSHKG